MSIKPKGILAQEADVGRRVVYRTAPLYEAEEGVITSIGRIGNVFVNYDGGATSQSTDMGDLDWATATGCPRCGAVVYGEPGPRGSYYEVCTNPKCDYDGSMT